MRLRKSVHLYGHHKNKLRIAERSGVHTVTAGKTIPLCAYDWIVEATGTREGLEQAVRMTRPRGTIVMKSTVHGLLRVDTAPIIVNEITLVGSRCGRFEPALKLLAEGLINVGDMISDTHAACLRLAEPSPGQGSETS